MRWDDIDLQVCSVARALSVVGERWTLLILRDAFLGTRRFDQFQSNLGITRRRLSERLGKLGEQGVLTRVRLLNTSIKAAVKRCTRCSRAASAASHSGLSTLRRWSARPLPCIWPR